MGKLSMLHFKQFIKNLSFEDWILVITGCAAIFITVLDFLNWLQFSMDTMMQVAVVSLGVLLVANVVQASQEKRQFKDVENQLTKFISNSLDVKHFLKSSYGVEYISNRLDQCQDHFYHVSLSPSTPRWHNSSPLFEEAVERAAKSNQVKIRYIANFKDEARFKRVKSLYTNGHVNNYLSSFFELQDDSPHMINFLIFDGEEVVLGVPGFSEQSTIISLRNRELVTAFTQYFNLLWSNATRFDRHPMMGNQESQLMHEHS